LGASTQAQRKISSPFGKVQKRGENVRKGKGQSPRSVHHRKRGAYKVAYYSIALEKLSRFSLLAPLPRGEFSGGAGKIQKLFFLRVAWAWIAGRDEKEEKIETT